MKHGYHAGKLQVWKEMKQMYTKPEQKLTENYMFYFIIVNYTVIP